jgi:hypothetical protein
MFRRGDCSIFLAIAFIASMVICPMARAQSNEWAWVNGTTTTDSSSVYGDFVNLIWPLLTVSFGPT